MHEFRSACGSLWLVALFVLSTQAQPPAPPSFSAQLLASESAVAPGRSMELAVELTIADEWHIYHPVILDAGGPTLLTFAVPEGVSFGEMRFPEPTLATMDGLPYLGYDERVVLLTELHAAEGLSSSDGRITIQVRVEAFACHDEKGCVPVEASASLTLPLAGPRAPAPTAVDPERFRQARRALPASFAKAEYLEGSRLTLSKPADENGRVTLALDETIELVATIKVRKSHHIQDRDPGVEDLIATQLWIEKVDGITQGPQAWPQPHKREMEGFGTVREHSGEFQIRAPLTLADRNFARGPITLRVLLYYQCCTDAGQCFPPAMAEGWVQLFADTPNEPLDSPLGLQTLWPTVVHGDLPPPAYGGPPDERPPAAAPAATATAAAGGPADAAQPPSSGTAPGSLVWHLLLALIGGLILNVMPCVLPVISIKILSFVKQAGEDRGRMIRLGLAYTAGVMLWFWMFAALSAIAWVPLQNPIVVIALTAVLFLMALNLFGVFEIMLPGAAAGKIDEAASREGYLGSFFKGFLATVLGTACTAPFLVGALAYAATQPASVSFAIFSAAGIGMASPYMLLAINPAWLRFVPKPGMWMVTFKESMGFILVGTALYLLWVLKDQLDADGLLWTVVFLAFLALAAWLMGRISTAWSFERRLAQWVASVALPVAGWFLCFHYQFPLYAAAGGGAATLSVSDAALRRGGGSGGTNPDTRSLDEVARAAVQAVAAADWSAGIPWQKYQPGLAEQLSRLGYTVYIDYTASWCVTCLANKRIALEIPSTREKMKQMGVIPIKADWSKPNENIRLDLRRYNQTNVPMNLVYPAQRPDAAIQLPITLLPGIVADALERAGPSNGEALKS